MEKMIQKILPDIINIRHQIHLNPELANKEIATSSLVAETLKKFGYDVVTNIGTTGVSALLDSGNPGKTVALRADMDALPTQELTQLPYQSKNAGVMHACGHDGHTATLLASAYALMECRKQFKGKIKLIFQPAEENGTGADIMIRAGILENPTVDAIFGYHNFPGPMGFVKTKAGCVLAGQNAFTIIVRGKGGHAALPNLTVDPIYIGSAIVQAVQGIVSRFTPPTQPVVLSITQFNGGTAYNVIPDEVKLNGSMRTTTYEMQSEVKKLLTKFATGIADTYGATVTINFETNFPPTINHPKETELLLNTAKRILGDQKVAILTEPVMASEDFSLYLEKIPGCFFMVGNGTDSPSVHNAMYVFNDAIIPIAAEVMSQVAITYLNQNG